ncbi:unnamed protein product [Effrenium voratum]|nr:unnamed protein product [Effrenium voratum]
MVERQPETWETGPGLFPASFLQQDRGLQLAKSELDLAAGDSRFGEDFFVDLVFQEAKRRSATFARTVPKNEDSAEEEEKLQQLAEEEAQLFEKARQVSQKLRAEEEQRRAAAAQEAAASSAAAADGDASDGDIEALEATLMGRTPREPSPTPSAGASEASQKEEAQPKQTANGEAGSPDPAPAPKPAPAPEKKPVPKAAPKAEPQAAADIDNLFSDFDAVLSGAGGGRGLEADAA